MSKENRVRVPQHIQDIARRVVELTMNVQATSKKLEEEAAAIDAQRAKLQATLEDLKTEETQLERECREWAEKKSALRNAVKS